MKVLVTGGSGFIGAWIVRRLLEKGVEPRVFDLNADRRIVREIVGPRADGLDWFPGDVSKRTDVDAAVQGCEAAVHLAGVLTPACRDNPVRGAEINLIGTLNLFEAAMGNGLRRLVYASTAGVFGPDDGLVPRPTTHYGAFKLAAEGAARAYWADHRFSSVGFRPFVIYGPGRETGSTAGPSLACRAAVRGEAYIIPYTGSAGYVYADDAAAAFEAALFTDLSGAHVFNLSGEVASVDDVIAEIRRHVPGAEVKAAGGALPIASTIAPDNLHEAFPDLPCTSLARGIAATIAHYRSGCPRGVEVVD
jgi:nucleoside-diphosphate-sugar epimerase